VVNCLCQCVIIDRGRSSRDANTASNHTEWVQVDLGTAQPFSVVDLYPRSDGANAGYGFPIDFTIAVSNNGSTWTNVVTKTGYPLPSGVQSFAFTSQTARYVRLTGRTQGGARVHIPQMTGDSLSSQYRFLVW
jgi:F5/8 type C domain